MKILTTLALFALAAPAAAAETSPASGQPGATEKKERKICKREVTSTGLHASRRICLTAAQWRARNRSESTSDMGNVSTRSN